MSTNSVAIIGMAGQFPGAKNIREFWQNLCSGVESIHFFSEDELKQAGIPEKVLNRPDYVRAAPVLDDIDLFDAAFFNYSPREAEILDPQQRLFLQCAWAAIEDAGYALDRYDGAIGVYAGSGGTISSYLLEYLDQNPEVRGTTGSIYHLGNDKDFLTTRISYKLNLKGPSVAVQTACSTSLVAVHLACQSLLNKECDMALAGGISIRVPQKSGYITEKGSILSSDGHIRAFDAQAQGVVFGSGLGIVLLKPLTQAIEDKDFIYAVIRGTAVNNDGGQKLSYMATKAQGQMECVSEALGVAGIKSENLSYIEAHGTGTAMGDPVEINALTQVFRAETKEKQFCAIGSVKNNLGHLDTAAGIVSLIKVALSLKYGYIPPCINVNKTNPKIDFNNSPFYVNTTLKKWPRSQAPKRAGVNCLGIGGTNAFAVLEEAPTQQATQEEENLRPYYLVVLSAKTEVALKRRIEDLLHWLEGSANVPVQSIAYTLYVGRNHFPIRCVFVVKDIKELKKTIIKLFKNQQVDNYRTSKKESKSELGLSSALKGLAQATLDEITKNDDYSSEKTKKNYRDKLIILAELYCFLLGLDLSGLYQLKASNNYYRIPLPTYPFAKERYWVSEQKSQIAAVKKASQSVLHPLVHQNTSTLAEQRFSSTFTGDEFFLKDHQVKGQKVLPGVAYLEMARVALQQATGEFAEDRIVQLKNIVWAQPVVVGQEPVQVHISLFPQEDEQIGYEIYTQAEPEEPVIHSQGIAAFSALDQSSPLDIPALEERINKSVLNVEERYKKLKAMGLDYGPSHQAIEKFYIGDNEILAKLVLPTTIEKTKDAFTLHPSLMDGALQAAIGLSDLSKLKLSLPFALERLDILGSCSECMWAWLRVAGGSFDKIKKLDIDLFNDQGIICIRMKGVPLGLVEKLKCKSYQHSTKSFKLVQQGQLLDKDNVQPTSTNLNHQPKKVKLTVQPVFSCQKIHINHPSLGSSISNNQSAYIYGKLEPMPTSLARPSQEDLQADLTNSLADVLYMKSSNLDIDKTFIDIGLDSILAVEWVRAINKKYELNITATKVYDYPTIRVLAEFLQKELKKQRRETIQGMPQQLSINNTLKKPQYLKHESKINNKQSVSRRPLRRYHSVKQAPVQILKPGSHYGLVLTNVQAVNEIALYPWQVTPPSEDEVTIEVKASAINFPDTMCIRGLYPTMPQYPFVPGFEVSGVVTKVGKAVTEVAIGESVIAITGQQLGGHASEVNVPVTQLVPKPIGLTFEEACSLPVAFGTVYYSFEIGKLAPKEHVLIQTATGGCGLMAIQLARLKGCICYGTSSQPEKLAILKTLELPYTINYKSIEFDREIKHITNNQGVDVVLNMLSGDGIQKGLNCLAPSGRYLEIAVHALKTSPKLDLSGLVQNQSIYSIDLRRLSQQQVSDLSTKRILEKMVSLYEARSIVPIVSRIYPIHQIRDALDYVSRGNHIGKVVISHTHEKMIECKGQLLAQLLVQKRNAETYFSSMKAISSRLGNTQEITTQDIAIIGMSGQFPQSETLATFWQNLSQGQDCVSEVPASRWLVSQYYDMDPAKPGKTYCKWMGVLEDVDQFDPLFFNISPTEAESMDPQQRLFLQNCWQCIEDAGLNPTAFSASLCGVFVGCGQGDYRQYGGNDDYVNLTAQGLIGSEISILAARIAYLLNLKGPCMAINTSCSSSLVALCEACNSLLLNTSQLALAGGVCVLSGPSMHIMTSQAGMLSKDGRCFTFDQRANGFVPGEGVGVILIKRLIEAKHDGDQIHGIIKGWGINQDGKTNGITAPSVNSQIELEKEIYERFNINPETISLIEAHGTGTRLGDPIEVEALKVSFAAYTDKKQYCALGSVKSNIGHLLAAAGISGVIKVLLALKHRMLPPTINFEYLNEHIAVKNSPFYINKKLQPWHVPAGVPRRAGVSSFGFSGTNAHLVVEEYIDQETKNNVQKDLSVGPQLIVLSAKTEDRLKDIVSNLKVYLEDTEETKKNNLSDIAYTLQVGREAMEERLGLIVSSIEELKGKLKSFLESKENIEELYWGQVKPNKEALVLLAADKEFKETLNKWIQLKKYSKLLKLWTKGLVIDWNKLYGEHKPKRISLPAYPFAKERYWVPEQKVQSVALKQATQAILHPLVHQNTSTLAEQRFSSIFTGDEFFLKDHRVQGQKVLPGVAYLEMARVVVERAAGKIARSRPLQLKNIVWAKPIVVDEEPVQVNISLFPQEDTQIAYEIYTQVEFGEPVMHNQGIAIFSSSDQESPSLDLASLKPKANKSQLSAEQCYERFKAMGIDYGPSHQVIETLYVGEDEVLAKLVLPLVVAKAKKTFTLHPSLMDGALQAAVGLVCELDLKINLPFALESLEILDACGESVWAWVRVAKNSSDKLQKLDIDLFDDQGVVCVQLRGFSSRLLEEGRLAQSSDEIGTLMLKPVWQERVLEAKPETSQCGKHYIFLYGFSSLQKIFQERLPQANVISFQSNSAALAQSFQADALQLFEAIKAVLKGKPRDQVLFQVVVPSQSERQVYTALSGLLKTAHLENPKVIGQVISIDRLETAEKLVKGLQLARQYPEYSQLLYQAGKVFIPNFEEVAGLTTEKIHIPWRTKGVYLITGGAGGLGLIFARIIAESIPTVTLILTGRSMLNSDKQRIVEELKSLGATVEYRQMDITDKVAVSNLIHSVQNKFSGLTGVLHSAGVIADNFILKKPQKEFESVLAPKITGTVNVDEATQALELDFFILFSSVASIVGNTGQADYATANGFMDAYAFYRNELVANQQRHGQTLSINWPLWKDGGMSVDSATESLMKFTTGLVPIHTAAGVKALMQGLSIGAIQILVVEGKLKSLHQWLDVINYQQDRIVEQDLDLASPTVKQVEDISTEEVTNYLTRQMSKVLKLPIHRIHAEEPLEKYGIDSIILMQLTNELEKTFGSLPKTLFFEYQTLQGVSQYFIDTHRPQLFKLLQKNIGSLAGYKHQESIGHVILSTSKRTGLSRNRFIVSRQSTALSQTRSSLDIAIIGLSGKYPQADKLEDYWRNLCEGKDCITEVPKDRWDWRDYYSKDRSQLGRHYSKWGGFISDVDKFDPLFFNISPREAELMDPQERLFLEYVWLALEDAGYRCADLQQPQSDDLPGQVGVYAGVMYGEYQLLGMNEQGAVPSSSYASIANRVSYILNLHGPSMAVDTMCSSSLTSIHLACQDLKQGRTDLGIAGGVNVSIHPNKYLMLSQGQFISSRGHCESFGKGGEGYIPGEGVGVVLLKRLPDAKQDQDHIYGVIKGSAVNHGGKTNGYTVPNPKAQRSVISRVLKESQIDPQTISYIEAHGTGTKLGDPIEITGLTRAFSQHTEDKQYCAIGSAKSNIGHCESAAGIAGLTKVLLQMRHRQLVPSLHSKKLNPHIDFSNTPFVVNQVLRDWHPPVVNGESYPRIAGISSFGAGGSNAHLIVEEYIDYSEGSEVEEAVISHLIVLSARTSGQLNTIVSKLKAYLDNVEESKVYRLRDIAYTLQVGREAMEERLGLIVNSKQALKDKLQAFLDGKDDIDNLYRGQVKRGKATLAALATDKEFEETLDKWIQRKKYSKLLDLWAQGLVIDWNKLYEEYKPKRISLPTYPFAKERYWVSEQKKLSRASRGASQPVLHPLVHQNTSTLSEQRFSSIFTGDEFFLKDHQIQGQKVLPGVAYLEMARVAIEKATGEVAEDRIVQLKNIVWSQPIVVNEEPVQVHISLFPQEDGQVGYEIYTQAESEEPIIHSQGIASFSALGELLTLDLAGLQARIKQSCLSAKQCYARFKSLGLDYGPSHQAIEKLYINGNEALAKLVLPVALEETKEAFTLHPSLMDGALQATIGLTNKLELKPALPFALEKLEILGSCEKSMWAWIRVVADNSDRMQKLEIDLCDDRGVVCAQLRGFSSRLIEENSLTQSSDKIGTLMFKPCWQEHLLKAQPNVIQYSQYHILFCGFASMQQELQGQLPQASVMCFQSRSAALAQSFQTDALQLFEAIKAVLKGKPRDQVLFQVVVPSQSERQVYTALSGLLKTAHLENSHIIGQVISIDHAETAEKLVKGLQLASQHPEYSQLRYRADKVFAPGFEEIATLTRGVIPIPWRTGGIYLITGGAGGLGLIFAQAIAESVDNVSLVLTGRSALSDTKLQQLEKIRALGAKVEYRQVDITDRQAVKQLINTIQKEFGGLTGVLHSAGINRDNFILKKTRKEFASVLLPKVTGTVNIDEATQDLELDFFILFSSVASTMGNIGQADYATANGFMGAYAHYRNDLVNSQQRHGQTLSINWPLWQSGGMRVGEATEQWLKTKTGMIPLQTENGIKALIQSLSSGASQILVVEGKLAQIQRFITAQQSAVSDNSLKMPDTVPFDINVLQVKVADQLKSLLSQTIKLPVEKLDVEETWESYGLDSIMITQLNQKLNSIFGEISKTLFYEYSNTHTLANYLVSEYAQACMNWVGLVEKPFFASNRTINEINAELPTLVSLRSQRTVPKPIGTVNQPNRQESIAIIGISGRYPQAETLDAYWENLKAGRDCITEIPAERWPLEGFFHADQQEAVVQGKSYSKRGGFITGFADFDPLFFNISPREAFSIDPQERLFIECCWATLEDAGYTKAELAERYKGQVGVFVGITKTGYDLYGSDLRKQGEQFYPHTSFSSVANRISYLLDLQGPSMPIDTMCSASLTAIHEACEHIYRQECVMALAGGVNLYLHPSNYIELCVQQMLSSDGQCKSFGEGGNGFVPGEGVGALLFKPLSQAEQDRDTIYAVIRSTSINHGGKTQGYTVPSPRAQSQLIRKALDKSGVDARLVSYIEAHGTGTALGDPIEITGLTQAFEQDTLDKQYCAIGSVKSNIGHLEAAAGIAGVTKIILQLKHRQLVPSLHAEKLNPNIDFTNTPFVVNQKLSNWQAPVIDGKTYPRIAGISSFGAGGSNAHLIIKEYIDQKAKVREKNIETATSQLIILSAKNEVRLKVIASNFKVYLENTEETSIPCLSDIAYTLQVGREAMAYRLAIVVRNQTEFVEGLTYYLSSGDKDAITLPFYVGNTEEKPVLSELLFSREGKSVLQRLLEQKKLEKLALYWANGGKVPWSALYKDKAVRRVSLPTYPFKKERYWPSVNRDTATTVPRELAEKNTQLAVTPKQTKGDNIQNIICQLVAQLTKIAITDIKPNKTFYQYGIDSLLRMRLIHRIKGIFKVKLSGEHLLQYNTVAALSNYLANITIETESPIVPMQQSSLTRAELSSVVPLLEEKKQTNKPSEQRVGIQTLFPEFIELNENRQGQPVFWIHSGLGGVQPYYVLAEKSQRPFYGIQPRGWGTERSPLQGIQAMAAYYVHIIQSVQPEGPYDLGGYSLGGVLAYEIARQLQEFGQSVNTLVMLDSPDSIGLKGVNLSSKSNLLLAINFQLMSTVMQNPREMAQLLIHRDELDINLRTSSFLKQLIGLARKRGLEENATDLQQAIEKQAKIQESYDILNSHILPLLNANSVQCYYFRNKSGLYLGELEPYFTALDGEIACDHINYWSEWQKQLPNFHIVDLDSPNHMMLLSEPKVYKTITEFCQALYSQQGMTPESFECFKSKAKKKHGIMRQKKQKPKKTHALREKETTVASEEAVT